jgi:hypothetical protein
MQERIEQLAHSFPSLREAPGVSPWDPELLDGWATSPVPRPRRVMPPSSC